MEVGPVLNLQDIYTEVLEPRVDLLQIYGDREVTLFGVTGPLSQLASMCPVDLSDPSMLDAVNIFVAKAANESGMEINPEHEEMFSSVIEETGAERKFVVAAESKIQAVEPQKEKVDAKQSDTTIVLKTTEVNKDAGNIEVVRLIDTPDKNKVEFPVIEAIVDIQILRDTIKIPKLNTVEGSANKKPTAKVHNLPKVWLPIGASDNFNQADILGDVQVKESLPIVNFDKIIQQESQLEDTTTHETFDNEFNKLIQSIDFTSTTTESIEMQVPSGAEAWSELLFEPAEIMLDDFVFGLESFADNILIFDISNSGFIDDYNMQNFTENEGIDIAADVSPFLKLVAEQLAIPENKEKVVDQVLNIVGAIHGIKLLEQQGAESGEIELVKEQLFELVVELFEQLGIEYNDELAKVFVWILLRLEYVPLQSSEVSLDSEELGTHESKRYSRQAFDPSFNDRQNKHNKLGGLAVLYTTILSGWNVRSASLV